MQAVSQSAQGGIVHGPVELLAVAGDKGDGVSLVDEGNDVLNVLLALVIPCASEREARFITPDIDVGETIECTPDLMEDARVEADAMAAESSSVSFP